MHTGCWHCPGPQPCTRGLPGRKGRAGSAKHVWCEHPSGGTAKALGPTSPFPFPPQQLLGRGCAILSTSCPLGPLPTPIRGVAMGQAGQVACLPGAGPGPDYVSEVQPGLGNSSCRAGDPPIRGTNLQGDSSPTALFPMSKPRMGPNCPPRVPLVWTLSPAFSPDHRLQPPLPSS